MRKLFLFISICIVVFINIYTIKLFNNLYLTFEVEFSDFILNKKGSIYYDIGSGYNESEKISFSYNNNLVKINIPNNEIKSIRFDPIDDNTISKELVIKNLKLNDIDIKKINSLHDISSVEINENIIKVIFSGQDPYCEFDQNIIEKIKSKNIFKYVLLLIFNIVFVLFLFRKYKNKVNILGNILRIKRIFSLNNTKIINHFFWISIFAVVTIININTYNNLKYDNTLDIMMSLISIIFHQLFYFSLLLFIFSFIRKISSKIVITIFYMIVYFITFLYYIDSLLYILQSLHIFDFVKMFVHDGLNSITQLIKATQIETSLLYSYALYIIGIIVVGYCIYYLGEKNLKYSLSFKFIFITMVFSLIGILMEQTFSKYIKNQIVWKKEQNSFPLYIKFFEPKDYLFKYKVEFKPFVSTSDNFDISSMKKIEEAKPNIYFFVVETLRNDMINEDTMPNLTKFRADCTFTNGIANANATHHAWFSILNSVYPIYWNEYRERSSKLGSLPLRILKNNDYKINVFSSAHLDYFDYIHTIFGSKPIYDYFYENPESSTSNRDISAVSGLINFSNNINSGNLNLVWLDSTHHNYFLPEDFKLKFLPVTSSFDYTKTNYSQKEVVEIKNKYKNSLFFVDSLLGDFFNHLKNINQYDNSLIVIVGDHGEEFLEHGHLAHSSTLYSQQINVSLNIKFPNKNIPNDENISSVDIFPTIFSKIGYTDDYINYLNGENSFLNHDIVVSGVSGLSTPKLFSLIFDNIKVIFTVNSNHLYIKEIIDKNTDNLLDYNEIIKIKDVIYEKLSKLEFIATLKEED